jgi:hypothetical protein
MSPTDVPTDSPTVAPTPKATSPPPTKQPTKELVTAKSGGGDNNSSASIPILVGIIIAALLLCVLFAMAVVARRERKKRKDNVDDIVIPNPAAFTLTRHDMPRPAAAKMAQSAVVVAPVAALTKRGDRLWADFRRVVSFDHQYFGNDLLALDDKQLQDAYAILAVTCPTDSFFGPLREVGERFKAQVITDADEDDAILDDLVDFLANAMPDVLMERAIDVCALGSDGDLDTPTRNQFFYNRAGCNGLLDEAAERYVHQADPLYYEPDDPRDEYTSIDDDAAYFMAKGKSGAAEYTVAGAQRGGGDDGGYALADGATEQQQLASDYDTATQCGAGATYDVAAGARRPTDGRNTDVVYEAAGSSEGPAMYAVSSGFEADETEYGLAGRGGGDFGGEPTYALGSQGGDDPTYETASGTLLRPRSAKPQQLDPIYDVGSGAGPESDIAVNAWSGDDQEEPTYALGGQGDDDERLYETASGTLLRPRTNVGVIQPVAYEAAAREAGSGAAYAEAASGGEITPAEYHAGATYDEANAVSVITPATYASHPTTAAQYDEAAAAAAVTKPVNYDAAAKGATITSAVFAAMQDDLGEMERDYESGQLQGIAEDDDTDEPTYALGDGSHQQDVRPADEGEYLEEDDTVMDDAQEGEGYLQPGADTATSTSLPRSAAALPGQRSDADLDDLPPQQSKSAGTVEGNAYASIEDPNYGRNYDRIDDDDASHSQAYDRHQDLHGPDEPYEGNGYDDHRAMHGTPDDSDDEDGPEELPLDPRGYSVIIRPPKLGRAASTTSRA